MAQRCPRSAVASNARVGGRSSGSARRPAGASSPGGSGAVPPDRGQVAFPSSDPVRTPSGRRHHPDGRPAGERHDREHRVHARRSRQRARVGDVEPGTPWTCPSGSATLSRGLVPIRQLDIWCAVKSRIRLGAMARRSMRLPARRRTSCPAQSERRRDERDDPARPGGAVEPCELERSPRGAAPARLCPAAYRTVTAPSRFAVDASGAPVADDREERRHAVAARHAVPVRRRGHQGNPVAISPGCVGAASRRKPQAPSISANASLMTDCGTPDQGSRLFVDAADRGHRVEEEVPAGRPAARSPSAAGPPARGCGPPASATSGARTVISPPGTDATTPATRPRRRGSARGLRPVEDLGARSAGVREVRPEDRLLGAGAAADRARPAVGAAADVARDRRRREPECRAGRARGRVRTVAERSRPTSPPCPPRPRRSAASRSSTIPAAAPLLTDRVGEPERRAPVHDRPAAHRAPRPDRHPAVGGRRESAVEEERARARPAPARRSRARSRSRPAPGRRRASRPRRGPPRRRRRRPRTR